jgi:hypothetical protein
MKCKGRTKTGKRCQKTVKENETLCHIHQTPLPYSQIQIEWIKETEKKQGVKIRHALTGKSKSKKVKCYRQGRSCGKCNECRGGEYYINGIGKVDGYCRKTNTVYEFHGDYWHGNPNFYPSHEIHPIKKVPFGQLYIETLKRDESIRQLGYNLITIWENEYKCNR